MVAIATITADAAAQLTQTQLAERWNISPRTLERWRWTKTGPSYVKIGGRVRYLLTDVEAYEAQQRRGGR
jgi:transcriptional regulator GlxA family with amidase domain